MTEYNQLYRKKHYLRGLEPNELTLEILKHKNRGEVLDLGCGEGQDAIFLAKQGFGVTAIDNSKEALKNLRRLAKKNKVKIKTELLNIEDFKFLKKYDLILAEASIHFLSKTQREKFIEKIQENTKNKGLNVIGVFDTRTSPQESRELKKWGINLLSKNELKKYYNTWKIILYKQFLQPRANKQIRGITQIIAQKL